MKFIFKKELLLSLFFLLLFGTLAFAQTNNGFDLYDEIKAASDRGDNQGVNNLLKQGESLWSADPNPYLDFELRTAMMLEASNHVIALPIFDKIMEKKAPTNVVDASNYFLKKSVFISAYLYRDEFCNNQPRLLQVARFLGEVRTGMLPGFLKTKNTEWAFDKYSSPYLHGIQGPNNLPPTFPPLRTNSLEELQDATNTLQSVLLNINDSLPLSLLYYCSRFPANNPTNAEFIKQVIATAHLNQEESKKLLKHKSVGF